MANVNLDLRSVLCFRSGRDKVLNGVLVSGCRLECVSSSDAEEDQRPVFMSAWPIPQRHTSKSLSSQEKRPRMHREPLKAHRVLPATMNGSLDRADELWRERVEVSWHLPNAAFDSCRYSVPIAQRVALCSPTRRETLRRWRKGAPERLARRHHLSKRRVQHSTTCDFSGPACFVVV